VARRQLYGKSLLRPPDYLSQGYFRPAETHRNPGSDELQHDLAGVATIIRHVIGELDADAPLFCHDSHFKWRRACRKTISEHRQPVPFREVEEHCRIAARGKDPSSRGIRPEPPLFKIFLPHHATHSILSIKDYARSTVEIEQWRRGSQLLELTSGFLTARAVAGAGQNRQTDGLDLHRAASAHREKVFVLLLVRCAHSWVPSTKRRRRFVGRPATRPAAAR
jgi:hypothetical protein